MFQDRAAEHRVVVKPQVVVETDPLTLADQRRVGEGDAEHLHRRIDERQQVDRQEGGDQHQRDKKFRAGVAEHGSSSNAAGTAGRGGSQPLEAYMLFSSSLMDSTASAGSISPLRVGTK